MFEKPDHLFHISRFVHLAHDFGCAPKIHLRIPVQVVSERLDGQIQMKIVEVMIEKQVVNWYFAEKVVRKVADIRLFLLISFLLILNPHDSLILIITAYFLPLIIATLLIPFLIQRKSTFYVTLLSFGSYLFLNVLNLVPLAFRALLFFARLDFLFLLHFLLDVLAETV